MSPGNQLSQARTQFGSGEISSDEASTIRSNDLFRATDCFFSVLALRNGLELCLFRAQFTKSNKSNGFGSKSDLEIF